MIEIRKTEIAELGILMELFEQGKRIMRKSGNMKQWTGGYPNEELVKKGAYVVYDPNVELDGILISCGSELAIALDTAAELQKYNINVRVVSMPSMFLFDMQPAEYKESVLPSNVKKRLAIEMGASMPWYKYASNVFGIDRFGVSAPIKHIHEYFGFTPENLAKVFKDIK